MSEAAVLVPSADEALMQRMIQHAIEPRQRKGLGAYRALLGASHRDLLLERTLPAHRPSGDIDDTEQATELVKEILNHDEYLDFLRAKAAVGADGDAGTVCGVGEPEPLADGAAFDAPGPDGDEGHPDPA